MKGWSAGFVTGHELGTTDVLGWLCPKDNSDMESKQSKERRRVNSMEPPVEHVFYFYISQDDWMTEMYLLITAISLVDEIGVQPCSADERLVLMAVEKHTHSRFLEAMALYLRSRS